MRRIDRAFAENFAREWIAAWNSRDVELVLSHYADDVELSSPLIPTYGGEPSGRLTGKSQIRAYWNTCLQAVPDLKLELLAILLGVGNTVAVQYRSLNGRLALEVFEFGERGTVMRASVFYAA